MMGALVWVRIVFWWFFLTSVQRWLPREHSRCFQASTWQTARSGFLLCRDGFPREQQRFSGFHVAHCCDGSDHAGTKITVWVRIVVLVVIVLLLRRDGPHVAHFT